MAAVIHTTPERFADDFLRNERERLDAFDACVLRGAQDGARILREVAPEDLGELRDSIVMHPGDGERTKGGSRVIATVAVEAPHAAAVETGRRAGGMPPVAKLEAWAARHGLSGAGFAIAKKIAQQGVRPTWFAKQSLPKMTEAVAVAFAALGSR